MGCLQRYGVPEQVLTENGIRHLLTAPRSPTTTGKVERLHKRMRVELFADADCVLATVGELQAALDAGEPLQHRACTPVAGNASTGTTVCVGRGSGS